MILEDVAEKLLRLENKYSFDTIVVDGASKQFNESLKHRVGLEFTNAEKTDKNNFIKLLNSDLITNRLKILSSNIELLDEWDNLIWHTKPTGERIEHPGLDNHLCDSTLYAWRFCYAFFSTKAPPKRSLEAELEYQAEQSFFTSKRDKQLDYDEENFNDDY